MHLIILSILLIAVAVFTHKSIWSLLVLWIFSFVGALLLVYMDHETKSLEQVIQMKTLIIPILYSFFFTGFISLIWKLKNQWLKILALPLAGILTTLAFGWAISRPIFTPSFYLNVFLISLMIATIHFAAYGVYYYLLRTKHN